MPDACIPGALSLSKCELVEAYLPRFSFTMPANTSPDLAALLQTALFDPGGEWVEGAYTDRWVANAELAARDLAAAFEKGGFSSQAGELLRAALHDPRASDKALGNLLHHLGPWAKPFLDELPNDPDPRLRALAVKLSAWTSDPLAQFWPTLHDASPQVRLAAVEKLAQLQAPTAQAIFRQALHDADENVRLAAAKAVQFIDDPEGAAALIACCAAEANHGQRLLMLANMARQISRLEGAPDHLIRRVGDRILHLLLQAFEQPEMQGSPHLRMEIFHGLRPFRTLEVAQAILRRLQVEKDVQARRILVLYRGFALVAEQSFPLLTDLLAHDPDPAIRSSAALLLEDFGAAACIPLLAALDDSMASVRRSAAFALGHCGDRSALPRLNQELGRSENSSFRLDIRRAIESINLRKSS